MLKDLGMFVRGEMFRVRVAKRLLVSPISEQALQPGNENL